MATGDDETRVSERYTVTVPAAVREAVDLEPGDRLRWATTDDGRLVAEVVRGRYGAADNLDPIDVGEETDAVAETEDGAYRVD